MNDQQNGTIARDLLIDSAAIAVYRDPRNKVGKRRLFNFGWWCGQGILWNAVNYFIFAPYTHGLHLGDAPLSSGLYMTFMIGLIIQTIIHARLLRRYFWNKRGNMLSVILMPIMSFFGLFFFEWLYLSLFTLA